MLAVYIIYAVTYGQRINEVDLLQNFEKDLKCDVKYQVNGPRTASLFHPI
jgi:hypothetical protein